MDKETLLSTIVESKDLRVGAIFDFESIILEVESINDEEVVFDVINVNVNREIKLVASKVDHLYHISV